MPADSNPDRLLTDISRWRKDLPETAPTYCQGIASKAAKDFEYLLKQVAGQRLASCDLDTETLLKQVKYNGAVSTIEKLPLGTTVQLFLEIGKEDPVLRRVMTPQLKELLQKIPEARNETAHELDAESMRPATGALLDLIEGVIRDSGFCALLSG